MGTLVTAQHVWSPFYVDDMIEADTNPDVTTAESNGSVDSSFGTDTTTHTTTTSLGDSPTSAASVADGSDILVATLVDGTPELLWYNSSGGLDSAYGSGTGTVTLDWTDWDNITGIVIQPNGEIDLAVQTTSGGMTVAQLTSTGAADTFFGSGGLKVLSGLPDADGLVLAGNGELLVAGVSSTHFVVAELNASSGALDTSYNGSGSASIAIASNASGFAMLGMALSPDGDLILAGEYYNASGFFTVFDSVLAAVTPAGVADDSFGTSGEVSNAEDDDPFTVPGPGPLAVNADGKILLGTAEGEFEFGGGGDVTLTVIEYNANGSLNTSFGTDGKASVEDSDTDTGPILNIQSNGQIVIGAGGDTNFILARFNADGTLDTTFGTSGIETGGAEGGGLSMTTASNGETVMIGTPTSGSGIILQEFHTLAKAQRLYVEQDADYNVTSITDADGNVVERYEYDPYGNVTVLNPNGTVRGDGTAASSLYGWVYLHQGLRLDVLTGLDDDEKRQTYDPALGRFLQHDPDRDINGPNEYQDQLSNPVDSVDPSGLISIPKINYRDWIQLIYGGIAHRLIAQWYGDTWSITGYFNTTPCGQIVKDLGGNPNAMTDNQKNGKPDIFNPDTGFLFEIKSVADQPLALPQANGYINALAAGNVFAQLGPRTDAGANGIIYEAIPGFDLVFNSPQNGVIVYHYAPTIRPKIRGPKPVLLPPAAEPWYNRGVLHGAKGRYLIDKTADAARQTALGCAVGAGLLATGGGAGVGLRILVKAAAP